jgi:ComEC/Rec2-related protein
MQKMHRQVQLALLFFIVGAAFGTSLSRLALVFLLGLVIIVVAIARVGVHKSTQDKAVPLFVVVLALTLGILRGIFSEKPTRSVGEPNQFQVVLQERIDGSLGRPESALAAALLSGQRTAIPSQIKDTFRASGLSHLLAVSGYNVTIVTSLLLLVLKNRAPPFIRLWVALIGIALFVIGAGASAAVVRAGIMGGLTALALQGGRRAIGHRALLLAAASMVLLQPWLVVFDIGFQLSMAATLSILVTGSHLQKILSRVPEFLALRTNLATTLSATIGTLPLIIFHFGTVPLLSIPANLLAAPFIPIAMGAAGLGALGGDSFIGRIVGQSGAHVLVVLETIAEVFAKGPSLVVSDALKLSVAVVAALIFGAVFIISRTYLAGLRSRKRRLLL